MILDDNTRYNSHSKFPFTVLVLIDMLYLIRQIIDPTYSRTVTKVTRFNPRFVKNEEELVLNGYLYDIPKEKLIDYIKKGYIIDYTTEIPYCHIQDAPVLSFEGGYLKSN